MLLIQGLRDMIVLPEITAFLLHQSAMDTGNECNIFITGKRGNGGSLLIYCSIVKSTCYEYVE